jgi:hypothetical protein
MTEQRIFRGRHKSNFSALSNGIWEDDKLSAEAKGTLGYLLSRPPNWHVRINQVGRKMKLGRDRLYRIMGELIDAGYVERKQGRKGGGSFKAMSYYVCDNVGVATLSQPEKPHTAEPHTAEPHTENQDALVRKDSTKKDSKQISSANKRPLEPIRAEQAAPPKRLGNEGAPRPESASVVQARLAYRFGVRNVEAGWLLLGELSQVELASLTAQERAGQLSDRTIFDIAIRIRLGESARQAAQQQPIAAAGQS